MTSFSLDPSLWCPVGHFWTRVVADREIQNKKLKILPVGCLANTLSKSEEKKEMSFRRTQAQDVFGFERRQEKIFHLLKRCTSQTSSQSLGARAIQTAKKASFFGQRARLLWSFFIRSIDGCTFYFSFKSAPCSSDENILQSKQRKR